MLKDKQNEQLFKLQRGTLSKNIRREECTPGLRPCYILFFLMTGNDLWTGPYAIVRDSLKLGIQICTKWSQACQSLTSQYWRNYHLNQWRGPEFVPETLNLLGKRLEEVGLTYFSC